MVKQNAEEITDAVDAIDRNDMNRTEKGESFDARAPDADLSVLCVE